MFISLSDPPVKLQTINEQRSYQRFPIDDNDSNKHRLLSLRHRLSDYVLVEIDLSTRAPESVVNFSLDSHQTGVISSFNLTTLRVILPSSRFLPASSLKVYVKFFSISYLI